MIIGRLLRSRGTRVSTRCGCRPPRGQVAAAYAPASRRSAEIASRDPVERSFADASGEGEWQQSWKRQHGAAAVEIRQLGHGLPPRSSVSICAKRSTSRRGTAFTTRSCATTCWHFATSNSKRAEQIAFTEQFGTLERHITRNRGSDIPGPSVSNLDADGHPVGKVGLDELAHRQIVSAGAVAGDDLHA